MRKILILLLSICSLAILPQSLQANTEQQDQLVKQLVRRITIATDAVDASMPQINILIKKGEKQQAKALVEKALKQIEQIEANQKQLAQLDANAAEDLPPLVQLLETKQYLMNKANQLRYTCIYLQCDAKLLDSDYSALKDDILTALSDENVSFVDSAGVLDWTITITAKVGETKKAEFGGVSTYFAYVNVKTVMEKATNGKRVLDKMLTEKGGSPLSFEQAAQEAYKKIVPKVSSIIKEQIAQ